jgi:hypothetical protein
VNGDGDDRDDRDRDEDERERRQERERRRRAMRDAGHIGVDLEWVASDEDDPDGGSGRTDADDGGYLPGEGTGRPYR